MHGSQVLCSITGKVLIDHVEDDFVEVFFIRHSKEALVEGDLKNRDHSKEKKNFVAHDDVGVVWHNKEEDLSNVGLAFI